jgi:hypothetical protein
MDQAQRAQQRLTKYQRLQGSPLSWNQRQLSEEWLILAILLAQQQHAAASGVS